MRQIGRVLIVVSLAGFACNDSNLRSSGKSSSSNEDAANPAFPLRAPCGPNGEPSTVSNKILRSPASKYTFIGELCPKGVGQMSLVFIVDFSQSMEFPAHLVDKLGKGNDPRVNDSCARLDAAKALVSSITSRMTSDDQVDISVIPFSDEVIEDSKLTNVDFNDFSSNLDTKHFCGTDGLTNYAAGIEEASKVLASSASQHKVIYFITDGMPYVLKLDANGKPIPRTDGLDGNQVDGPKAQQEGRDAMSALRSAHPNLVFYSLFLGNKVEDPQKAVDYLSEVSGKENVKVATEASKLAEEIVKFSLPGLAIDPNSITVSLDDKPLPVLRVAPSAKGNNIWELETQNFDLKGRSSVITVQGKTVSGKPVSTGATITTE